MVMGMRAPTYQLQIIPGGEEGIRVTLRLMSTIVKKYKKAPAVRELALLLTKHLPQKSWLREVKSLHKFVRDDIRYVKDIRGVETIQTPIQTLRLGAGDCDDKSTLIAALLESIGHPTRFKAVGFSPGRYSHVYPETKVGGKWLTIECTEPVKVGWRPPKVKAIIVQHN